MARDIDNIDDLSYDENNANEGTDRGREMVRASLAEAGAGRSIVVDQHGKVIAGNKTLEAAEELGLPITVVKTDGNRLVVVQREDLDLDDERARKLAYYDNRTSEVGLSWSAAQIVQDLEAGLDLTDMFRDEELNAIVEQAADGMLLAEDESGLSVAKDAKPNPRQLPIDVIYTLQTADCTCCLAVQAGLKYGIQSASYRLCPYTGQLSGRHEVAFIDNDYFKYDHEKHLQAVAEIKPKYATVRDVMTRTQCQDAGIEYYELSQVLAWAEELEQYAENVIVIPKYDCLDQIPERFVLGYSVPTSHGGTPLPVSSFKGRRVHLLGGSWKAQLAHMAELGDDVVSLDNNYVELIASKWGQWITPEGKTSQVQEILPHVQNVRYVALAISFGNIGVKVNELYAHSV